jgi:hypothetical protein
MEWVFNKIGFKQAKKNLRETISAAAALVDERMLCNTKTTKNK